VWAPGHGAPSPLGLGAALLLHVTLHWDWVIRTTRKLLSPRGHDKVIWLVNLALLVAMTFCVASGILISRVALPSLGINRRWRPGQRPAPRA